MRSPLQLGLILELGFRFRVRFRLGVFQRFRPIMWL